MNKPHEEDFDMIYAALLGGVISGVISNALPIIVGCFTKKFLPLENQQDANVTISLLIALIILIILLFMRTKKNKKDRSITVVGTILSLFIVWFFFLK